MFSSSGKYKTWLITSLTLLITLTIAIILSLSIGEFNVSFLDAIKALFSNKIETPEVMLIKLVRFPRIILAIAVGGSLSLAGMILQGIYRNPLVEPFTLGISGGASLGVAAAIVFGLQTTIGAFALPAFGFAGAFLTILLVYILSSKNGKINIQTMLLIGVMVSFVASSALMFLMAITTTENLQGIIFWTMGSLNESNTKIIWTIFVISIVILTITYLFAKPLNALRLGEDKAKQLGINTDNTVKILFVITSILTGICVSVVGVIGFVGLIIPHILRSVLGNDYRILLINSFLLGGIFIVCSDIIARTIISPNELPIGVITGIIGGISFIFIMSKKK